jgi:hypothetical protein
MPYHSRKVSSTLGWFARDAQTLSDVGTVLLPSQDTLVDDFEILIPQEAVEGLSPRSCEQALYGRNNKAF